MATAGSPASTTPSRNRSASSASHDGARAQATATTPEAVIDSRIGPVRPTTSDQGPATRIARPRPSMVSDIESVLWAVETSNSRASSGSSAWVL